MPTYVNDHQKHIFKNQINIIRNSTWAIMLEFIYRETCTSRSFSLAKNDL